MTWSYSTSDLDSYGKDTVRWFVGDTDSNYPQLQDEEIAFALSIRGNAYGATALCAQALAAKYSRLVNTSADGVSMQHGARATQYATLAREYEQKQAIMDCPPYAGGLSVSDMEAVLSDPDKVPSIFRLCMFDNPPTDGVKPLEEPGGMYGSDNSFNPTF